MSTKIAYLLCLLFCLGACTDDRFSDSGPVIPLLPGETIPVSLALDVAPLSPPPSVTTRTDGNGSGLKASFGGMEVELSGIPVADTRTFPVIDEDRIYSLIVLQFNGTLPSSKCIKAVYQDVADGKPDLSNISFDLAGDVSISRIVVIANLSSFPGLNIPDWNTTKSKTYQDLLDLNMNQQNYQTTYPLYNYNNVNRAVMVGISDVKLEVGKLVTVVLQRNFAKASFKIDIAEHLKSKYSIWVAQLSSLPKESFLISSGRGNPFHSGMLGEDGYYESTPVPAQAGVFPQGQLDAYLPVNIHPEILTASEQTRTLLAPKGTTYLQLMGYNLSDYGAIENQVIYQIYLGGNFTTNYTISPNISYIYTIHVKDDNPLDGTIVKFVAGYWGGQLKAYNGDGGEVGATDKSAVKWQYTKRIEVYPVDVNPPVYPLPSALEMIWAPGGAVNSLNAISLINGKQNTWNIMGSKDPQRNTYQAANACFLLNNNPSSIDQLNWYLPSISQLTGTYLVASGILSSLSDKYWSSTAVGSSSIGAFYITKYGDLLQQNKTTPTSVRAVRDLE